MNPSEEEVARARNWIYWALGSGATDFETLWVGAGIHAGISEPAVRHALLKLLACGAVVGVKEDSVQYHRREGVDPMSDEEASA